MAEYIVDCEHVSFDGGPTLVLPRSTGGHVHERLIRCRDCDFCSLSRRKYCRTWHRDVHDLDGFCHRAQPRSSR